MLRLVDRVSFAVIGALALALVAVLAGVVDAGPLDPTSPPGSTMKTLDDIPGSWSRKLPADDGPGGDVCNSSRFTCLLNLGGTLDAETGLVWQTNPSTNTSTWVTAHGSCDGMGLGGRAGWRLPTIHELRSLVDGESGGPSFLPTGHPFGSAVTTDDYWSATSADATTARAQQFDSVFMSTLTKTELHHVWCVRGNGQGYEAP